MLLLLLLFSHCFHFDMVFFVVVVVVVVIHFALESNMHILLDAFFSLSMPFACFHISFGYLLELGGITYPWRQFS